MLLCVLGYSEVLGKLGLSPLPVAYSLVRANHDEVTRQKEKIPSYSNRLELQGVLIREGKAI